MRQRASLVETVFIQRQIQRRILHVKLCVTGSDFTRLDAEHFLVELDTVLDIVNVERQVCLQSLYFV